MWLEARDCRTRPCKITVADVSVLISELISDTLELWHNTEPFPINFSLVTKALFMNFYVAQIKLC